VKYIKNKIEKSFSPKLTDYFIQGVRKYNGQKKKDKRTKRQKMTTS
jgi:siroheme synthase (precorrin-2 oxidase/ferrochelatase)